MHFDSLNCLILVLPDLIHENDTDNLERNQIWCNLILWQNIKIEGSTVFSEGLLICAPVCSSCFYMSSAIVVYFIKLGLLAWHSLIWCP